MNEYTIYSDMHIGGQLEINSFGEKFDGSKNKFSKNTIFLGDNFDFRNALHKNLKKLKKLRAEIKRKVVDAGGIFIDGNHEVFPLKKEDSFIVRDGILFIHGDVIEWGFKKAHRYRKKNYHGKSIFYWKILHAFRNLCEGNKDKLTKKQINLAVRLAKDFGCKKIVMGHFHPKKNILINKNEIQIVAIKKGITKIPL